jgi:hypothetical protein
MRNDPEPFEVETEFAVEDLERCRRGGGPLWNDDGGFEDLSPIHHKVCKNGNE